MQFRDTWEEAKNLVKERADLVEIVREHVDLKRSGFRYLGACPFHQEKTPSFTVHPDQQFYHCFGCKASGDVFSFMMEYHHMTFPDALKALAQRYQVELPEKRHSAREQEEQKRRQQMYALNQKAAEHYRACLLQGHGAQKARAYLQRRGIPAQLQQTYQLGYAPAKETAGWNFLGSTLSAEEKELAVEIGLVVSREPGKSYDRFRDRIMFPITDVRGRICGFGGRILGDGEPKYLNSPESPIYSKSRLLFGLYQQRDGIRRQRRAVLVEGNFDLLALVAGGLDFVVAPLGTALTREQLRQLKPLSDDVVLLFDGDSAGLKAAERAVALFLAEQISGRVAVLPGEHDPDSFIREFGPQRLRDLIEHSSPLPEFVVERFALRHGQTLDGKFKIIEELRPLMAAASSPLQREAMARHFGEALKIDPARLLDEFKPQGAPVPDRPPALAAKRSPDSSGLSGALKGVVSFLVLHPGQFSTLKSEGLEEVLAGTVGETICLQLQMLCDQGRAELQPEDLLNELPPGEERSLVASILAQPLFPPREPDDLNGPVEGLDDIVAWLRQEVRKKRSEALMIEIRNAEKNNDFDSVNALIQEKMKIDSQLKMSG
jgi:DNA primase